MINDVSIGPCDGKLFSRVITDLRFLRPQPQEVSERFQFWFNIEYKRDSTLYTLWYFREYLPRSKLFLWTFSLSHECSFLPQYVIRIPTCDSAWLHQGFILITLVGSMNQPKGPTSSRSLNSPCLVILQFSSARESPYSVLAVLQTLLLWVLSLKALIIEQR